MKTSPKTKIIVTIGPATDSISRIEELVKSGARIFRLNTSHGRKNEHKKSLIRVRRVSDKLKIPFTTILDLQGPRIRLGIIENVFNLDNGSKVILDPTVEYSKKLPIIPVDYKGIVNDVKKGDKILLNDGRIILNVLKVEGKIVRAKVISGGMLTSRKGLNIPGTTTSIPSITEKDIEYIKFAVKNNVDYLALSFVRCKEDILEAKRYLKKYKGNIPIIAKIEKPQAVKNILSIIDVSDGIMVARGDLGIEISAEKVPIVQKKLIAEANQANKPVIVATQMLESMIENPLPTRAETSDVANAIIDGADAVMLSGETSIGKYPFNAVRTMHLIAKDIEKNDIGVNYDVTFRKRNVNNKDTQLFTVGLTKLFADFPVKAIVVFTNDGNSAILSARARSKLPVVAICDNKKVCSQINLFWGIKPFTFKINYSFNKSFINKIDQFLIKNTILKKGDKIIITAGLPYLTAEKTSFLKLHQIGMV